MKKIFFPIVAIVLMFASCQKEFTITVSSNNTDLGITSGSGTYQKGSEIEISAIPKSRCKFVKWEDGDTNNPRRITIREEKTYTAVFDKERCYSLMLDGKERDIWWAGIDESDLDKDKYYIKLFMTGDSLENILILGQKHFHDGQVFDLSQKEEEYYGYYWLIGCYVNHFKKIFEAEGDPFSDSESSGTLYIKRLADSVGQPVFEIRIENGVIKGKDEQGNEVNHTIELNFKGELQRASLN